MQRIHASSLQPLVLAYLTVAGLAFNSAATAACLDPNTCYGTGVLGMNTLTGTANSGFGYSALYFNTTGSDNTASGYAALYINTSGSQNTASGGYALFQNTDGDENTASGHSALYSNTTGSSNTASGSIALYFNTTGFNNTATGRSALSNNTSGSFNTASGFAALGSNTAGDFNTADGTGALYNATGHRNVALGYNAGSLITTGSDNITIGAQNQGKAGDNGVTRIGSKSYQAKAFIAGISGVKTGLATAKTVFIDANGQLGTIKSSRIYKEDIQPMGSVSERLLNLRPVTFRYKEPYDDGSKPIEFGLIAEDVAEVFPELVVNDSEGKPETVRYDLIATLMLNEFEKEHAELAALKKQVAGMAATIELLERERGTAAARQP